MGIYMAYQIVCIPVTLIEAEGHFFKNVSDADILENIVLFYLYVNMKMNQTSLPQCIPCLLAVIFIFGEL